MEKANNDFIEKLERYKTFNLLKNPIPFNELFIENYNVVQLHSIQKIEDSIIGFCGVFKWEYGALYPLDGDSYSENMLVYGYEKFYTSKEKCGQEYDGLDILVYEW